MTASTVKGATAGKLLAVGIKHAIEWIKKWTKAWTREAAKSAANTDRMEAITRSLARVHGEGAGAQADTKVVEAIKPVGYTTDDAHGEKLIKAEMSLASPF